MKHIFLLFILLFTSTTRAQEEILWKEDYGPLPRAEQIDLQEQWYLFNEHQWLYELLISSDARKNYPEQAMRSFVVHLKDTYEIFPAPEALKKSNLSDQKKIVGKITYVVLFKKFYRYDIVGDKDRGLVLNVRVHFEDASEADKDHFARRLYEASQIWNQQRIQLDFPYAFQFDLTENEDDAHFSVEIEDETRGPYDSYWARNWTSAVVAHELGHMIGLGDEYETLTSKINCLRDSLMCSAWSGNLMPHHYYFVLRRLMAAR